MTTFLSSCLPVSSRILTRNVPSVNMDNDFTCTMYMLHYIYIILKYLHNLFLCPTRISIRFKALLYLQMTCNILLDLLFHISWMFAELDTCIVKAKCRSKCSYNVCLSYHSIFISLGNVRTNTPVNEITVLVTWLHYFPLIFLWLIFHNISNS